MIEGSIFSVGKMYISMVLIALILGLSIFMFEINQSNNFKQYVNYQIERNGGLTPEVIDLVNNYSEKHFNGNFTINQSQATDKKPYGTVIEYVAHANFKILFLDFDIIQIPINGSSISLVR